MVKIRFSGRTLYLQLRIQSTMNKFEEIKQNTKDSSFKSESTSFVILKDGSAEMIYDPVKNTTKFVVYKNEKIHYEQSVCGEGIKYIPYSPDNNLIKNKVLLFPSEAKEYNSEAELLKDIQKFIYKYVDFSPFFHKLTPYYVLFSWVYDCFNEVPYLRFIGDTGSGKSRAVETIGSICYKPIFATGGATVSPIFRILDLFKGTLLLDEADYRFSDEKSEIIKILNCGNTPTFPVLRNKNKNQKEYEPVCFQVFGPKILDTRGYFKDVALENRCLTEEMGQQKLRDDIPINLPNEFHQEALEIRNKLLMFRLKNYGKKKIKTELIDKSIEPRLNQIVVPLASIISDQEVLKGLKISIREYNAQLISDRGMGPAGEILEIIQNIKSTKNAQIILLKDISSYYIEKYSEKTDSGKQINPKWVGWILRKDLKLKTRRTQDGFIIRESEKEKLENLFRKFGIGNEHNEHNEHKPESTKSTKKI